MNPHGGLVEGVEGSCRFKHIFHAQLVAEVSPGVPKFYPRIIGKDEIPSLIVSGSNEQ